MESPKCCRVCLDVDGFMYNLSSNTLAFYYLTLTGINPLPKLIIPMYVCYECTALLKKYFLFRQKCLRGHAVLQALISNSGEITDENLKDIGRESFGLTTSLRIVENVSFTYDPDADSKEKTFDLNCVKIEDAVKLDNDYSISFVQEDSYTDPILVNNSEENELIEILEDDEEQIDNDHNMVQKSFQQSLLQERKSFKLNIKKRLTKKDTADLLNFFTIKPFTKQELMDKMELRKQSIKYKTAEYKCEVCYSFFIDIRGQEKHAGQHDHCRGDYHCKDCKMYFRTSDQLQTHLKSHPRWFTCKSCPQSYSDIYRARLHLLYHQGQKYKCDKCGSVYTNRIIYLRHIRNHHPIDFTCCFCGVSLGSQIALNAHKAREHDHLDEDAEKMNITAVHCEVCDITFTNGAAYNVHKATTIKHSGKYRFSCDNCNERFSTKSERLLHSLKVHKTRPRRIEKPIIMIKATPDKPKVKAPPVKRVAVPPKARVKFLQNVSWPVKCHYCPHLVYSERENWIHYRRQHPEKCYMSVSKRYICEQCGKGYKRRHTLNYHMNLHNGVNPYKCEVCGKAFYSQTLLKNHLRIVHSDERRYVCDTCGLALKTKGSLFKHNRIHTGEKPFKCDVCDKAFAFKTSRRLHYEGVHLHIRKKKKKKSKKQEVEREK